MQHLLTQSAVMDHRVLPLLGTVLAEVGLSGDKQSCMPHRVFGCASLAVVH
jgi:hypothetical protein